MKIYKYETHVFKELAINQKDPVVYYNELGQKGLRVVNMAVFQEPSSITTPSGQQIPYIGFNIITEQEIVFRENAPSVSGEESK